jgi:hypothetical protein
MMDWDSFYQLWSNDSVLALKNATRFLHFIGLAVGLGAATVLDLMLMRFFVRGRISEESWAIVNFGARIVHAGLILLWITGIAFIVQYALFEPVKLTNEKIWAKLAIVSILTVNGSFIHSIVLPRIKARIGRSLFDGVSRWQKSAFIVSGAVSAASWYAPVALGAFSQLNFVVPAVTILALYALLLLAMALAMHFVMWAVEPKRSEPFQTDAEAVGYDGPPYQLRLVYGA